MRPSYAEIDLAAIAHNVALIAERCAPARICAVVKADGYGHGAREVARTALGAGATDLAVALVDEGIELRDAGFVEPILLLSEPRPGEMRDAVAHNLRPTVYSSSGIEAAAAAAAHAGTILPVHLKVDTGMHRVGVSASQAVDAASAIDAAEALLLEGVYSHCAVSDELDNPFTAVQFERMVAVLDDLAAHGFSWECTHFSNSAAALTLPHARFDMVRIGIAMYGIAPARGLPGCDLLRPAMSLHTEVSFVKTIGAGEAVSYGLTWASDRETVIATLPVGYADGVRRNLSANGGCVLLGGGRVPIVGRITMDQMLIDCGPASQVVAGDPVVLLGVQGAERIDAHDIADELDTIAYEIVCDVTARIPRRYV